MRAWVGTSAAGRLVSASEPALSLLDHGFLLGDGLFETILTRGDRPMALRRHLNRLATSAHIIGVDSVDEAAVLAAVQQVLGDDLVRSTSLGRMRITLTSGVGPLGMARGADPSISVLWQPLTSSDAPVSLAVSPRVRWSGEMLNAHKHTSWLSNVLAYRDAAGAGASDALLLNDRGEVVETATANIFAVKDGTLITPPLESGCLPGITRQLVIESLPTNMRFAQMAFSLDELLSCDEVFVTSSLRLIQSVSNINSAVFPPEREFATKLMSLLEITLENADD